MNEKTTPTSGKSLERPAKLMISLETLGLGPTLDVACQARHEAKPEQFPNRDLGYQELSARSLEIRDGDHDIQIQFHSKNLRSPSLHPTGHGRAHEKESEGYSDPCSPERGSIRRFACCFVFETTPFSPTFRVVWVPLSTSPTQLLCEAAVNSRSNLEMQGGGPGYLDEDHVRWQSGAPLKRALQVSKLWRMCFKKWKVSRRPQQCFRPLD